MWYDNLENKNLWRIFNAISEIPRESGHEEKIREFLVSWAKEHNLEAKIDRAGNVIIKAEATKGMEKKEPLALQAHMDMVCVKKEGSKHDFRKDPIEILAKNGKLVAKDTSLGADNGIGMAIAMDALSDKELEHGRLEAIFTFSEETGLNGAFQLEEKDVVSRRLINLDSEEEGIFYIGCAGGVDITADYENMSPESVTKGKALRVKASGMLGGHSGGEIHKERANAIKVLSRALYTIQKDQDLLLSDIKGGTRRNVIPSSAEALIVVNDADKARRAISELQKKLSDEYSLSDPNIRLDVEEESLPDRALSDFDSYDVIGVLYSSPNGVRAMSLKTPGIVETSSNLAVVSMKNMKVFVEWSVRSLVESLRDNTADEIIALASLCGFNAKSGSAYPGWAPNPDSKLSKELREAYRDFTGKDPIVTSIHAGLECGIINDRIKGMDSISIGPDLFDVHSVNENLDIKSAERLDSFIKAFVSKK